MEEELEESHEEGLTVLAPTDDAFDARTVSEIKEAFSDAAVARTWVENHLLTGQVCCSGMPRYLPYLDVTGHRTKGGQVVSLRRSRNGHIYAGTAEVGKCDMVADNGVVHEIDQVIVPVEERDDDEVDRAGYEVASQQGKKSPFFLFNLFKK